METGTVFRKRINDFKKKFSVIHLNKKQPHGIAPVRLSVFIKVQVGADLYIKSP